MTRGKILDKNPTLFIFIFLISIYNLLRDEHNENKSIKDL